MVCEVCGQNPRVRAKKAFFGKKPFLGRVASIGIKIKSVSVCVSVCPCV